MEELAANEIIALRFALNHLWASTGGKGQPWQEWLQSVLATLYGEDYAEPVPIDYLSSEEQAWQQEAVQEGLDVLAEAVRVNQAKPLGLQGEPPFPLVLDPADEAKSALIQAQDDFRVTAPLIWLMDDMHQTRIYKRAVQRSINQLARIWQALEELEEAS